MSINTKNHIRKSLKFVLGVGLILLGFTSEVSAAFFKCARCNFQSNKCAKDVGFFKSCEKNCPISLITKLDPIEKCRAAYCEKNKQMIVTLNRPISETEMKFLFGGCSLEVKEYIKTLVDKLCARKQQIVNDAIKNRSPLKEKTVSQILYNCPQAPDLSKNPESSQPRGTQGEPASKIAPESSQPRETQGEQARKTANDFSDVSKFCPLQLTAEEVQKITLGDPSSQKDPNSILIKGNFKLRASYPITQERRELLREQAKKDGTDWPLKSRAYLGGTQSAYTCSYEDDKSNLIKVTATASGK